MKVRRDVVLGVVASALLSGCVTYSHEWRADSVGGEAVGSSRIEDHVLKTKSKYRLVGIRGGVRETTASGGARTGAGRQTSVFAKELEAFAPEVFSSSPDAVPVTIEFAKPYSTSFSWFAIFGYNSVDTVTPFTVCVEGVDMPCACGHAVKLRTVLLEFFPFAMRPDTDFYSRAYMTLPGTIPSTAEFSDNFRKSWMLGLAIALKNLENSGRIGK